MKIKCTGPYDVFDYLTKDLLIKPVSEHLCNVHAVIIISEETTRNLKLAIHGNDAKVQSPNYDNLQIVCLLKR